MKIVFITNFFNHHQKFLANALDELTRHNFHFVETERISEERLVMGWGGDEVPEYVVKSYTDENAYKRCLELINSADVVIRGNAPYEMIKERLCNKKLTFCYSERLYKKGFEIYKWPVRLIRHFMSFGRFKNLHILCASAFTSADYAKTGTFINKAYKWGYFTQVKEYENIEKIIESKKKNSVLWVARLIELKHPEAALYVAKRLRADGYDFNLDIIGNGVMYEDLQKQIETEELGDRVCLLGSMKPEQVREYMEQSEIFLFTSDKNEGWGAVVNESMNSGCAVVASHAIGSVPFLIKDGENGLIYKDGNLDDLYNKVKYLLDNQDKRIKISKNAYRTMTDEWNGNNAARKFIKLCEKLLNGEKTIDLYPDGVCSKAGLLKDNWKK